MRGLPTGRAATFGAAIASTARPLSATARSRASLPIPFTSQVPRGYSLPPAWNDSVAASTVASPSA